MTYNILATGSTGNATIINDEILIDCGVPYKTLRPYVGQIRLVLLTHEHGDHFNEATIRSLAHARPALRFGCCRWLVWRLLDAGVKTRQIDVYEADRLAVYSDFAVQPVKLTHNVDNCGFKLYARGESLFYATDTGTLDGITAKGFDYYFVEANHRRDEISEKIQKKFENGAFAYELRAAENHLSLEQAADWLVTQMGPRSIWIPMHGHVNKGGKQNGVVRGASDAGEAPENAQTGAAD